MKSITYKVCVFLLGGVFLTTCLFYFYYKPTESTIVVKAPVKVELEKPTTPKSVSMCSYNNGVLSIRLTVTKDERIFAYDSQITEEYFREQLKKLPDGCDNARITFLYEKGTPLTYLAKINSILETSSNFKNFAPILLETTDVYLQ